MEEVMRVAADITRNARLPRRPSVKAPWLAVISQASPDRRAFAPQDPCGFPTRTRWPFRLDGRRGTIGGRPDGGRQRNGIRNALVLGRIRLGEQWTSN